MPALKLYTGGMYEVAGFREAVCEAEASDVHCLILSGGFGFVLPEEQISKYEAPMRATASAWKNRLGYVLRDYVARNDIARVFVGCSQQYAQVLGEQWIPPKLEVYWYIPTLPGHSGAMKKVP